MTQVAGGGGGGAGGGGGGRASQEKPLEQLTHQDIMQLTREDCRRYLKEKGMRRPSWNKSQAIQQVLSLKNLFDSSPSPEDDTNFLPQEQEQEQEHEPSFHAPRLQRFAAASNNNNNDDDDEARKLEWIAKADLPVLASSSIISAKNVMINSDSAQLTIFYCGNVNVFNDVPADKAKAIMVLAGEAEAEAEAEGGTPNHSALRSSPVCAVNGGERSGYLCSSIPFPSTTPLVQIQKETPITRKASLQRFLEKKDRSRCKRSGGGGASKKPPVLMGMFMHPSYWSSEAAAAAVKKNPTKSSGNVKCSSSRSRSRSRSTGASPTRPPQTPSSDEQDLIFCRRKSVIQNYN